jgi:hypothetical protein
VPGLGLSIKFVADTFISIRLRGLFLYFVFLKGPLMLVEMVMKTARNSPLPFLGHPFVLFFIFGLPFLFFLLASEVSFLLCLFLFLLSYTIGIFFKVREGYFPNLLVSEKLSTHILPDVGLKRTNTGILPS